GARSAQSCDRECRWRMASFHSASGSLPSLREAFPCSPHRIPSRTSSSRSNPWRRRGCRELCDEWIASLCFESDVGDSEYDSLQQFRADLLQRSQSIIPIKNIDLIAYFIDVEQQHIVCGYAEFHLLVTLP